MSGERPRCGLLCPQLHELRAKELLVVARAFSVERLPDSVWASEASEASEWRERALELCLESLRRHESFLDSSWVSLLPFKPHSWHSLEFRVLCYLMLVLLVPI